MGKKVLFCASTASHIRNFHLPYLRFFKESGWTVEVAVPGSEPIPYADQIIDVPFDKRMSSLKNIRAILVMARLLASKKYDIISAHTALASIVARMAVLIVGKGNTRVIYTVHGYLFSEHSGLSKWMYILPEKICSRVTDLTMVMNAEDLRLAHRYQLSRGEVVLIPGMGVDLGKFSPLVKERRSEARHVYGFNEDDFLFLYAAELSKRKNQGELIKAFAIASREEQKLQLLLAGDGVLQETYRQISKSLGVADSIHFLGHVTDMPGLYGMVDAVVSSSKSEGLPFNIMEAMACGLPVVASRIKGHVDLMSNMENDLLYASGDESALANKMLAIYRDQELRTKAASINIQSIEGFSLEMVYQLITEIYKRYM